MERSCERALELGLPAIAFTEHAEWNKVHPGQHSVDIAGYLDALGMSGADCAAGMLDGYAGLLEQVGLEQRTALRSVTTLFAPLMIKYRHRERAG